MFSFLSLQLILRAASVGEQATAAIADALHADALGAAKGRFGVDALRKDGMLPAAAAAPATPAEGPPISAADVEPTDSTGAATAAVAADVPTIAGVTTVLLDEADPDNILLERMRLTADGAAVPSAAAGSASGGASYSVQDLTGRAAAASLLAAPRAAPTAAVASEDRPRAERYASGDVVSQLTRTAAAPPTPEEAAAAAAAAVTDAPLSALDQCVVLALCLDVRNSNPADGLTSEEMRT